MEKLRPRHELFHSFCVLPTIEFESQINGERPILLLRAHPITQVPWILNGLFLFILLVLLNVLFAASFTAAQQLYINVSLGVFILAYYWFKFLSYYFNVGIVTQGRIIDIDLHAVIYKEVTEAQLKNVEDITAKSGGYIPSLFNFGNVYVQTAGALVNIEFDNIPRPAEVVKIINQLLHP